MPLAWEGRRTRRWRAHAVSCRAGTGQAGIPAHGRRPERHAAFETEPQPDRVAVFGAMTIRLVLYGAGAVAREIVDALVRLNAQGTAIDLQASIVDPGIDTPETFRGRPVVQDVRAFAGDPGLRFVVALGEPAAGPGRSPTCGPRSARSSPRSSILACWSAPAAGSARAPVILGHSSITADARLGSTSSSIRAAPSRTTTSSTTSRR